MDDLSLYEPEPAPTLDMSDLTAADRGAVLDWFNGEISRGDLDACTPAARNVHEGDLLVLARDLERLLDWSNGEISKADLFHFSPIWDDLDDADLCDEVRSLLENCKQRKS